MQVNIHEPSMNLPQLVERAIAGEEIILNKAGEPIAKLIPYAQQPTQKARIVFGVWEGKVKIAEDFDQLPPDIAEAFGMEGYPYFMPSSRSTCYPSVFSKLPYESNQNRKRAN